MTDLQQALAISGGIFAVIMLSQYGDREASWHKFVLPVLSLGGFGFYYLKDAPTAGADWVVYAVGAAVGLAFGLGATAATKVYRRADGQVRTVTGPVFAAIWLGTVVLRVGFVALAEHDDTFRTHLGEFMMTHSIVQDAIAPFFLVMAAVTVLSRVGLIALRVRAARTTEVVVPPVAAVPAGV